MKIFGCGLHMLARSGSVSSEGTCRLRGGPRLLSQLGVGAAAIFALALAGCGGGGSGPPPPPPPPPAQYTIGGSVSGLTGTGLVLQDNGGDDLSVTANGAFTFATKVNSGGAYSVTVSTQPSGQTCSVTNGSGTASGNVTNVAVACATGAGVTIGGTVSGLTGTGLVLQDNGGDNLSVTKSGPFTFTTAVATGKPYAVTVLTQPSGQTCTVANGTGTTSSSNVTNVAVNCGSGTSVGKFAYVANYTSQTIDAFAIDPTTGKLTAAGTAQTAGDGGASGPAAVSLAPNGKFAFSASDNGQHIYAFTIQSDGSLKSVGAAFNTGFTTGMAYPDIAVDAQSAHLYIASAGDNKVAGFSIDSTGKLTALTGSPYPAGGGASGIPAFSPNGNFLYVMDNTANAVSGYTIGAGGVLTPMASTFATGTGPTWIVFTPDGKFAYVSDSGVDAISAYSVDATGALKPLSTPTFATDAHPADLTIDAAGKHLYAPVSVGSNPGAIDVYTINADGTLTAVQMTATAPVVGIKPMFVAIDPTAGFAYVADAGGGEVYQFSINSSTGALKALTPASASTGANSWPQFITIDPSGKYAYTANENASDISEFQISSTGALVPVPGSPTIATGNKPIFVSISPEAPGIRD